MAKPQQLPNIPIFDLSPKNLNPSSSSWIQDCKNLSQALEEYGFFIATYDDVSSELDEQLFDVVEELFELPLETKTKNTSDLVFYGYVGQLLQAPLHESMGIPDATTTDAVQSFTNLMWPSGNKRFCETIMSYVNIVSKLEQRVDRMVFESYGAQKHYEPHVGSTTYLLRTIKYTAPGIDNEINSNNNSSNDSNSNSNIGSNPHTDKGFLSILHPNHVNGLEIQLKNGEWFALDVPPGSFVIMAGDAYEAWSNGRVYAAKHQVLMTGDKPRYCVALFSFNHGLIHTPEELIDPRHPMQFKPFDHFGMVRFYLSGATDMVESSVKAYCGASA